MYVKFEMVIPKLVFDECLFDNLNVIELDLIEMKFFSPIWDVG